MREATAQLSYGTRDATFNVHVVARVSEAGTGISAGTIEVRITRCGTRLCDRPVRYVARLTGSQLSVANDLSSGRLRTTLFGRALSLAWDDVQGPVLPMQRLGTSGRSYVTAYRIVSAHGYVAGRPCLTDQATIARGLSVDLATTPAAASLPRTPPRSLKGLLTARCLYTREID